MHNLPKENIYGHTKKLTFLIEHINKYIDVSPKPINLLDFGCGNGSAVSQYLITDQVNYYGVDIHEPSLEFAKQSFSKQNAVFSNCIPEGRLFDIIVYADILEHLDDPISILRSHNKILKNDGIIIGAIPNGYGPFENEKRIVKWLGITAGLRLAGKVKRRILKLKSKPKTFEVPYNSDSGHIQFFTKKNFFSILKQTGFKIERFKKGVFLGAPFTEQFILRGPLRGERFAKINAKLGDFLPYWAVSTWYFIAKKQEKRSS